MIELHEDAWCLQWEKKGYRKGKIEGQRTMLRHLLRRKFGRLNKAYRQRISSASAKKLLEWHDRLLDAGSVEEVLDD